MHEADHRFTVEGYVCGLDGRPSADVQVIVKDLGVSEGASAYTNSRGYYRATLHLHNENRGDPILVKALNEERRVTALFDPKDRTTERVATVHFGSGCEQAASEGSRWLYYGAGVGLVAVMVIAGTKWLEHRRRILRHARKGRGKR